MAALGDQRGGAKARQCCFVGERSTFCEMKHQLVAESPGPVRSGNLEVEIIDLRTIIPFDHQTCIDSVSRTGRLLVLQESQWSGGLGHTIQSRILEDSFWALETRPVVIGALDTPVPFSPPLEDHTVPDVENVVAALLKMCQ